jgi:hypothetical protein
VHLIKSISDIIKYLKSHLDETDITLYIGATDREITSFENSAGVKLPDDIKQFYQFCNGFISDEDQFQIVPLNELIHNHQKENKLYIAEYLVYCDMWELKINPLDHNDYTIFYGYTELTDSFSEFLMCFFVGGVFEPNGLYDWKDKLRLLE